MASKKKEAPPEQLTLPGIDPDAFAKEHRANVIRSEFGTQSHLGSMFGGMLGRGDTPELSSPLYRRDDTIIRRSAIPGRRGAGYLDNTTFDALRLSEIPTEHFPRASSTIIPSDPRGYFSRISRGEGGAFSQETGDVIYSNKAGMPSIRAILTHELGHAQQADLPKSVQAVEIHKSKKQSLLELANKKDKLGAQNTQQGPVIFMNDSSGIRKMAKRKLARYYNKPSGEMDQLEAVPLFKSDTPIVEGSAEAYRKKYQGPRGHFPAIYSPQFFAQTEGPDAGRVYQTAHDYTERTGNLVTLSHIQKATRLAGVLATDLDDQGKRQQDHDVATSHRMMQHLLEKEMGVEQPAHADEFEQRMKAIEGEHVQQSLFPDLAPDINQFGKAPTGTPERSPRGVALATGQRTEIRPEETATHEGARQEAITKQRREDNRGMERVNRSGTGAFVFPYESKHRTALRRAARDKSERDAAKQVVSASDTGSSEMHPKLQEYIDKLVYDKKKSYATDYITAVSRGGELPALPKGLKPEHAENVHSRVAQIMKRHGIK